MSVHMLQQIEHQYAPLWAGGKTNMKLGKWLYRTFVLVQLSLAIYFSNQAIMSWYRAPIVVSVDTVDIDEIDFPAVSICHPVSWTWPSLLSLLHTIDPNGTVIRQIFSESIARDDGILSGVRSRHLKLIKAEEWDIWSWSSLRQSEFINEENEDTFYFLHFMAYHLYGNETSELWELLKVGRLYYAWKSYDFIDVTNMTALKHTCTCKHPYCTCTDQELELFQSWTKAMTKLTDQDEKVEFYDQICSVGKSQVELNSWCNDCLKPAQNCIVDEFPDFWSGVGTTDILYTIRLSTLKFKTKELLEIFLSGDLLLFTNTFDNQETGLWKFFQAFEDKFKLDVMYLWFKLNEVYLNEEQMHALNLISKRQDNMNHTEDFLEALIQNGRLNNILSNPKIHGDPNEDFVLIPLCSHGSKQLTPCNLFERNKPFYHQDQICYTYNADPTIENSIDPLLGLTFAVNFRLPRRVELEPATLIIHPKGEVPDMNYFPSSTHKISPGYVSTFGVQASITNVTDSFQRMGFNERKCSLPKERDRSYHQSYCKMLKKFEVSKDKCNCLPWFVAEKEANICMGDSLECFERANQNQSSKTLNIECPKACISTSYSIAFEQDQINEEKYLRLKQSFGDIWEKYLSDTTLLQAEPYLATYNPIKMMARTSLVHVNFNKLEANKITKDAKVTFPDALGNIGGTFGVFLGLSFVGILDFILLTWNMLKSKLMKKSMNP